MDITDFNDFILFPRPKSQGFKGSRTQNVQPHSFVYANVVRYRQGEKEWQ
jgi:hypothetical protein